MAPRISTDDSVIQPGSNAARTQLDTANATAGVRGSAAGVDPRLSAAVDDAGAQNRRSAERTGDGIERTKRDSAGKSAIDKDGSSRVRNTGGLSPGALNALRSAGSALLGGGGAGAASPAAAAPAAAPAAGSMMPSMPQMPQVPAATAGQSIPSMLSNPAVINLLARLLSADSASLVGSGAGGLMGAGGLSTLGGSGGGSGTVGPTGSGSNQFEQRLLAHARQVAAAGLPYTWGGGGSHGPGQGIRDGGPADMAGDYAKTGFDCSSLAQYLIYQSSGVEIPRVTYDQYRVGVPISPADARPGDLIFSRFSSNGPEHVTIYVGGGKVIEAAYSGTTIGFANARDGQFMRFVAAQ